MTVTDQPVKIEFTDEIANDVRDTQHALDLGRDLPADITMVLLEMIGRDQLRFPQPQQINGLVKQIHMNLHPEKYSILGQISVGDRNMIDDFETFKRIITGSQAI